MGNVAYDAFRTQVQWLMPWDALTDEQRADWEKLANDAMTAAENAVATKTDSPA